MSNPVPTPLGRSLDALKNAPTAPERIVKLTPQWTPKLEVGENGGELVTKPLPERTLDDSQRRKLLTDHGLDPDAWVLSNYRYSVWDAQVKGGDIVELTSHRFNLEPRRAEGERFDVAELVKSVGRRKPRANRTEGEWGFVYLTGDWQLGKMDGDGAAGTVDRIESGLHQALDQLKALGKRYSIGHVHSAFVGDCIEGFVSQGGGNAWRTNLTLTEQLRISRRLHMEHIVQFAPLAEKVTAAGIGGNHGESVRFGKGVTRYDDSLDTEPLIAAADAAAMVPALQHVEFFTPKVDGLTVLMDVAGTALGHAHGHQWRHGKHWEWLDSNCGNGLPIGQTQVMVAGHHHHLNIQERGRRTFIQTPAQESSSMWWQHQTGQTGNPGSVCFLTKDGVVREINVMR